MSKKNAEVIVIGAGGHAVSVVDVLLELSISVACCLDGPEPSGRGDIFGVPVLASSDPWRPSSSRHQMAERYVVAIGDNHRRMELFEALERDEAAIGSVIAKSAEISPTVVLGTGVAVLRGAIVHAGARIGDNVILNTRSSIDHDCVIGAHAHLGPASTLAGGVQVGRLAFVGAGATVVPGITIGDEAVVGAGAVVIEDVAPCSVVAGCPARPLLRSGPSPSTEPW